MVSDVISDLRTTTHISLPLHLIPSLQTVPSGTPYGPSHDDRHETARYSHLKPHGFAA